jgi:uncharacterized BrkB/YihY/UPF0761 family membrane protein
VPLTLVLVAGLGFLADANAEAPKDLAKNAGISGLTAQSIGDSAKIASGGRWITMAVGLIALYSGGVSFVKAMRTAHALAWHERVSSLKRVWRGVGVLLAVALGAAFTVSVLARVRAGDRLIGLGATIAVVGLYGVTWLGVTMLLPHGDAPWTALVPGAILVGIGLEVLHLVTVYYVAGKLSSSSDLYGPLGAAVALLGWAYLFGRLTVAAAMLNATLWERPAAASTNRQRLRSRHPVG